MHSPFKNYTANIIRELTVNEHYFNIIGLFFSHIIESAPKYNLSTNFIENVLNKLEKKQRFPWLTNFLTKVTAF